MLDRARKIVADMLAPQSLDDFLARHFERSALFVPANERTARRRTGDEDPEKALLAVYDTDAQNLTSHAADPSGPPPGPRRAVSPDDYRSLVADYQAKGHTVRIPSCGGHFAHIARFARALTELLSVPVETAAFWSAEGAKAPVHYDDEDLFAIQMHGQKRWFVSTAPPRLPNPWRQIGEQPPELGPHRIVDMAPGDLLYVPRGTPHYVTSTTDSIHLSVGFSPLTTRDAIVAMIDQLADLHRPLREGFMAQHGNSAGSAPSRMAEGLSLLAQQARNPQFLQAALASRTSRMIGELPKLEKPSRSANPPPQRVRQADLAISSVLKTTDIIDFSQPGEHMLIHRGAEEAVRFIAETAEFSVDELPGGLAPDVKNALVAQFIGSGFLVPVDGPAAGR